MSFVARTGLTPFGRIGLVDLEDGPRLMAHLLDDMPFGAPVAGRMEGIAGAIIPVFQSIAESKE